MKEPQIKRLRWAVRLVLALGVAASVAANILHANPNPISQTIAAWPSLAFLLTVELCSRIPIGRPLLAAARIIATAVIAGIAGWVSYWHMVDVAARYGETNASPYLLPITVDGLIVVASVSLVELAARLRALTEDVKPVVEATVEPLPIPVSPGMGPVETPPEATVGGRKTPQGGRRGPQVVGASRSGLSGKALMEEPPQV